MHFIMYALLTPVFLAALVRPFWAFVAVIVAELSLNGYLPGLPISARLAIAVAATIVAAPAILRTIQTWNAPVRRVVLPAIALVVIATVMNSYFSNPDYVFKFLRRQILMMAALLLAASTIEHRRALTLVAGIALLVGVTSAVFAVLQQVSRNPLAFPGASLELFAEVNHRSVGLVRSPVNLANHLTFVLLPVLALALCAPTRMQWLRVGLGAAAAILMLGVYVTYTRSALLGIGPGLLVIAAYVRGWRRASVVAALIAAPLLYYSAQGTGLVGQRYYLDTSDDPSAASHLGTMLVGLELSLDNWAFGIGHEWFEEASTDYADVIGTGLAQLGARGRLGEARPHNDFLNVWFSWGIGALIAYLAVFVGSIVNCTIAARSNDWFVRSMAIGCAGGLATYAFGSALHNYFDASTILWLYAGLSAALVPLARIGPATAPLRRAQLLRGSARLSAESGP
ncbi:MAG: O-antigen ligase family protein [Chloroflexi bacterium]|nr:O-antigen ligase family protein [Chloroflexota bacterium]